MSMTKGRSASLQPFDRAARSAYRVNFSKIKNQKIKTEIKIKAR
jgi:hypothetical protein